MVRINNKITVKDSNPQEKFDLDIDQTEYLQEVSNHFSDRTYQEILPQELNTYYNFILQLRNELQLATAPGAQSVIRKDLTIKMKNAYLAIMKFRTMLLGADQEILYKLYIRNSRDMSKVSIVNLTEEQLMTIVERSGNTLRLKRNIDLSLKVFQEDIRSQALFDKHFADVKKSLKSLKKNNYVVPFSGVRDIFNDRSAAPNLY